MPYLKVTSDNSYRLQRAWSEEKITMFDGKNYICLWAHFSQMKKPAAPANCSLGSLSLKNFFQLLVV